MAGHIHVYVFARQFAIRPIPFHASLDEICYLQLGNVTNKINEPNQMVGRHFIYESAYKPVLGCHKRKVKPVTTLLQRCGQSQRTN